VLTEIIIKDYYFLYLYIHFNDSGNTHLLLDLDYSTFRKNQPKKGNSPLLAKNQSI